jgi:hypothetical protein
MFEAIAGCNKLFFIKSSVMLISSIHILRYPTYNQCSLKSKNKSVGEWHGEQHSYLERTKIISRGTLLSAALRFLFLLREASSGGWARLRMVRNNHLKKRSKGIKSYIDDLGGMRAGRKGRSV